jgi:hypothetical protein
VAPPANRSRTITTKSPSSTEGSAASNGAPESNGASALNAEASSLSAKKSLKIATVSHTLAAEVAERLRNFAFRERISESAVIEFALRELFSGDDDPALGSRLRASGAALRRKSS